VVSPEPTFVATVVTWGVFLGFISVIAVRWRRYLAREHERRPLGTALVAVLLLSAYASTPLVAPRLYGALGGGQSLHGKERGSAGPSAPVWPSICLGIVLGGLSILQPDRWREKVEGRDD
jgi:hypothetical protein